jgi:hypothetical protein
LRCQKYDKYNDQLSIIGYEAPTLEYFRAREIMLPIHTRTLLHMSFYECKKLIDKNFQDASH